MQEIFSYDSKIMQILLKLADLLILNVLYILLCIPIITIGAAQAGLHSGIRQMMNKEDDRSCIGAFFKGFASGFWKITLAHTLFTIVIALLAGNLTAVLFFHYTGAAAPVWMCIAALCICAPLHTVMCMFHSNFDCSVWQLIRNAFFTFCAYPLRMLVVTVLIWLPLIVVALDLYTFMQISMIWLLLYYSVACLFSYTIANKAFEDLKSDFLGTKEEQKEAEQEALTDTAVQQE